MDDPAARRAPPIGARRTNRRAANPGGGARLLRFLALLGALILGGPAAGAQQVAVSVRQRVHPVLIRNERNPLLEVQLIADRAGITLRALEFTLDGTDDLADLSSLEVLRIPPGTASTNPERWLEPAPPARRLTFRGELPLQQGTNLVELSCRLREQADLLHRVAATCTRVETSAGWVSLPPPERPVSHRIGLALRRRGEDGVHTYRIPALATSARGTLLAVYDMRRRDGRDLQEDIDIGLSRSLDGGRTWDPPKVIMDMGTFGGLPQEQNGCSDPGIIVDRETGEIFCFAVWMHGKPGKHQWTGDGSEPGHDIGRSAQFLVVRSRDDGKTWSPPENLTRSIKPSEWWLAAPSPQQGIQLADGTLVMPAQGRDATGREFSTLLTSRDHGGHWTLGSPAFAGSSECQAVALQDGSILLNMRNENRGERARGVCVTRDLGRTWAPHPTHRRTLIEPNCNASLLRVRLRGDGRVPDLLLFSNPHSTTARTHQTIQVSFDEGLTWPETHHLLLDEGRGAGYSSLTRIDEQHVGIVYEGSRAHLVFEKIPIATLLQPGTLRSAQP